jgi:chemotaxis protein CheD
MPGSKDLIDIFLQPGDLQVADAGYQLRTILGSCVSITLWHAATRIGAMSHFLLPTRGGPRRKQALDGRYGDEALQAILKQLKLAGVAPAQCQGKIFGGGNMFATQLHAGAINVGQRNGEAARTLLREHGITVASESLFGFGHRQIIFDVSNGDVWSHQVKPSLLEVEAEGTMPWHVSR